jgi:arylsulfatase A-like enzyme
MTGVVLITADTLRADHVGCYGGDVHTPNLDRLAAEGTLFERNYAASYPTIPNRHDLWTGRYNFLRRGWTDLTDEELTLPQILASAGVTSFLAFDTPMLQPHGFHEDFDGWHRERGHHGDRWHTAPAEPPLGAPPHQVKDVAALERYWRNSADWRHEDEFIAPRTARAATEWLEANRRRESFALVVDTWDPHEPFDAPAHHVERYDDAPPEHEIVYPPYGRPAYLTDAEHEHVRARYAAEVTMVDAAVGRILDALDRVNRRGDVVVIVTSDHGHLFGEHDLQGKPTGSLGRLYEESTHTPLIVRHPDHDTERVGALTQPPDLLPTMLDVLDVEVPDTVQGTSLLGLLEGSGEPIREYAITARYTEGADTTAVGYDGWAGQADVTNPATVTGERWAYVCTPDPDDAELYDLDDDPDQDDDVADEHPSVAAAMREHYLSFVREHGGVDAMRRPFEDDDYRSREAVGDGATVYAFEVDGRRYAHRSTEVAQRRRPPGATAVEAVPFGEFAAADAEGLVFDSGQYYYARELAE